MTELSQEARALIEQGRSDDSSTSEDRARIRRRLAAELGGGVFATAAVAGVVASASPASGLGRAVQGSATWLKGALAVTAIAGGAVIAYVGTRPALEQPAVERARATTSADAEPAAKSARLAEPSAPSEAPVVRALEEPLTPARETTITLAPAVRESTRPSRRSRRAVPTVEAPALPAGSGTPALAASAPELEAPAGSVTAELALLAEAQRALRAGDARKALTLARQHREQFARGALAEERAGIETLARCKLGEQPEATARAFLAQAPSSPLAARVRKECGIE